MAAWPTMPEVPKVNDERWVKNDIDRFILAKQETKKLPHAPEADKTTLLRRVTLDLTGLPPTPAEVDALSEQDREILNAVTSAICDNFSANEISDETSPDTVATWDSVTHLNLVLALEEAFGTSFTPEETLDMTSAKLIRMLLEEKGI